MLVLRVGKITLVILALSVSSPDLRADGCIFGKGGKYIPEKGQQAFIEWDMGQERLFVATRVDDNTTPSLWIVPVPAVPEKVKAEPVDKFPHVVFTRSVVEPAKKRLDDCRDLTLVLDTGLLWGFVGLGTSSKGTFSHLAGALDGVQVHQHVEKFGMVVEVLTAKSTDALDAYLADKKLDVRAANIKALEPYFHGEYTFICAWSAEPNPKVQARAVRIDFPSPAVFYPLRPTRVYQENVDTTIFVRGWFQPSPGLDLPGLRCRQVRGKVAEQSVDQTFARTLFTAPAEDDPSYEPVTRVELNNSPQGWTQDLTLEPGAPAAIRLAQGINSLGGWLMLFPGILGAVLASFLPFVVMGRDKRRWIDWPWAWAVGASMLCSIFASALVFFAWCRIRKPVGEQPPLDPSTSRTVWFVVYCIQLILFLILAAWTKRIEGVIGAVMSIAAILFVILGVLLPVATFLVLRSGARGKRRWMIAFITLHIGISFIIYNGLMTWLSQYA